MSERLKKALLPCLRRRADGYPECRKAVLAIDDVIRRRLEDPAFRLKCTADPGTVLIAVDGMCGSGKTTLGDSLKKIYGCRVFHMDDYFLRPEQRTPARFREAGGNVDYERIKQEILDHAGDGEGLVYRPFDCGKMAVGEPVTSEWNPITVIEGAYSQHPFFGDIYDLRFFCEISEEEQKKRILARNGERMLEKFLESYIPMENRYFQEYAIRDKSIPVL